jgi:integration host factor subunit alpha
MKKTLTKKDLANVINKKLGYSKEEAKGFTQVFFNSIINNVVREKKLKITKLGTFLVIKKKARMGRNPKTQKEALITERNVISFKFSKLLRDKMNE